MGYDIFRFGFAVIFVGLHCFLMGGLLREWLWDKKNRNWCGAGRDLPKVSVIVPISNEALRMAGLLQSLARQDYPRVEYIFVNDRSTDESPGMLCRFAADRQDILIITLKENPSLNHKQYALGQGIEAASGDLFLFTDADCEVPVRWIWSMAGRMAEKTTGAVIGPVFKRSGGAGFFHLYQCFDHAVRYMYLAAATGLGAAGGGFGNNLILRRDCLESIGGYGAVPESPTEDAALISRIRSRSACRVHSAIGGDTHVITEGENSWKDLINQTLRWNNGGLFSPDPGTRFNFGFLMITISMGILAIPLLPLFPRLWPLTAAVMAAMTGNTLAVLRLFGVSLPRRGWAYLIQLVFTPMYFTFLTILGMCGFKVSWKGSPLGSARLKF
ncbi:MAG: glycosyltransferase [Treponema sp.]|jgi:cellulose synthase/poly-beta-1,6-N-acetylglucosamine synthase-like glycosyltransferase|nr:glycosyltransferase [Treponema sp.]